MTTPVDLVANRIMNKIERLPEPTPAQVANDKEIMASAGPLPPPAPEAPSYTPSEGAKRTQKLIEQIEQRRQEKAKLVAQKKSREVEVQREDAQSLKRRDDTIDQITAECGMRINEQNNHHQRGVEGRAADLDHRAWQISKIDASLEQLRKQLDAELGKLDPERKGAV